MNKLIKYFSLYIFCAFCSCSSIEGNPMFSKEKIEMVTKSADNANFIKADNNLSQNIDLSNLIGDYNYSISELVDSIKLIFLDSSDECILGLIDKILITENNIYIVNVSKGKEVVIFDNNGRFVNRIKQGQGPGEINNFGGLYFDKNTKQLIVHNNYNLNFYTPEGRFIKEENVPFAFQEFISTKNGYIFYQQFSFVNKHLKAHENSSIIITDKSFNIKSSALTINNKTPMGINGNYMLPFKDEIIIKKTFCDTIYSLNESNKLYAKYILNLGKNEIPKDKMEITDYVDFERKVISKNYVRFTGEYLETSTHQFFRIYHKGYTTIFRDKRTGNLKGGNTINWSFDTPNLSDPNFTYGDWFIVPVYHVKDGYEYTNKYISDENIKRFSKLSEDDNPVLFLFKVKKF